MKRILVIIFPAILAILKVNAQTLTYNNFVKSTSITQHVLIADKLTFNLSLLTTTGNGVTWDATGIKQQIGTPPVSFIYGDPSLTPNGSLYPNSNLAQYDPALTALIGYNYFQLTNDSIVSWGDYQPSTQHEIFQNPDKRLIFPLSYGDFFTDTYAKTNYSNATTISSYQTGSRTVTFNGYGTLILPQGKFNNVALISELRTNSLGPNSTDFTWFNLDDGRQLMYFAENDGKVTIFYTSDIPSGIKTEMPDDRIIYSNTISDQIKIVENNSYQIYRLFDINGKLIKSGKLTENNINVADLTDGYYLLQLVGNKIIQNERIMIMH